MNPSGFKIKEELSNLDITYTCSFAHEIHPKTPEMRLRVQDYLGRTWPWPSENAKAKFLASNTEDMVAFLMPRTRPDLFEIACLWATFGFLVDDVLEDIAEEGKELMNTLINTKGGNLPPNPTSIQIVMHEIFTRCATEGGAQAQKLFKTVSKTYTGWAKYIGDSARTFDTGSIKTLDQFIEFRRDNIGGFLMWCFLRWAYVIDLPQGILHHPDMKALEDIVTTHCLLVNDIYSSRKELLDQMTKKEAGVESFSPNAVLFIMKTKSFGLHDAVKFIESQLPQLELDVLRVSERVKGSVGAEFGSEHLEALERYLEAFKLCMGGNCAWSQFCKRYNDF